MRFKILFEFSTTKSVTTLIEIVVNNDLCHFKVQIIACGDEHTAVVTERSDLYLYNKPLFLLTGVLVLFGKFRQWLF